jgi:GT2 family glycosyltransferase
MQVTVIITSFNDIRILKTIESLLAQKRRPEHIIIADGGSPSEFFKKVREFIKPYPFIEYHLIPGRSYDTRRKVIHQLVFDDKWIKTCFRTDIVAWIDSDELAMKDWLGNLIAPIEANEADFTGGPWIPTTEKSKPEKILNIIQLKNQALASKNQAYIAMGNSAWNVEIFRKVGGLDGSSESDNVDAGIAKGGRVISGHFVSEDFDLNVRAQNAGFRSRYVPEAVVYHDQSHINTFTKLIKYQYNNYVRVGMAYFKNRCPMGKFTLATKETSISHPFELILLLLKPIALLNAWEKWNDTKKPGRDRRIQYLA